MVHLFCFRCLSKFWCFFFNKCTWLWQNISLYKFFKTFKNFTLYLDFPFNFTRSLCFLWDISLKVNWQTHKRKFSNVYNSLSSQILYLFSVTTFLHFQFEENLSLLFRYLPQKVLIGHKILSFFMPLVLMLLIKFVPNKTFRRCSSGIKILNYDVQMAKGRVK